jgi:hypothetical protein
MRTVIGPSRVGKSSAGWRLAVDGRPGPVLDSIGAGTRDVDRQRAEPLLADWLRARGPRVITLQSTRGQVFDRNPFHEDLNVHDDLECSLAFFASAASPVQPSMSPDRTRRRQRKRSALPCAPSRAVRVQGLQRLNRQHSPPDLLPQRHRTAGTTGHADESGLRFPCLATSRATRTFGSGAHTGRRNLTATWAGTGSGEASRTCPPRSRASGLACGARTSIRSRCPGGARWRLEH